jgi:hypothetical protein
MTDKKKKIRMTANEAHDKFGHADNDATQKTAKELEIELICSNSKPCAACAAVKAKQKSVPKVSDHVPAAGDERQICMDISTVKKPKDLPEVMKPNWRIMVDE